MSLLLVAPADDLAEAVVVRLVAQQDEVRVIEQDPALWGVWAGWGARVASGDPADADLVERASQNVRTIVVVAGGAAASPAVLDAAVAGGRAAGVDRIVYCADQAGTKAVDVLESSGLDFVALTVPRRRWRSKPLPVPALAEAIDAADDLDGHPRLLLDLAGPEAWATLLLEPPR